MVEYTLSSSSQQFRGRRGTWGTGHNFLYFRELTEEELLISEGLPVYLTDIYGEDNIKIFFSVEIWENLKGWSFNKSKQSFITPEIKLMKKLAKHDPLTDILAIKILLCKMNYKSRKI